MESVAQMLIVFGAIAGVILLPIYWRNQMRRRVLEMVKELAGTGAPMPPDLVLSLMSPPPQASPKPPKPPLPGRERDIRRGVLLLSLTVGIALIGLAAFGIGNASGDGAEAAGVGIGIAAVGAIPGCIGLAFLLLGLTQKAEA